MFEFMNMADTYEDRKVARDHWGEGQTYLKETT